MEGDGGAEGSSGMVLRKGWEPEREWGGNRKLRKGGKEGVDAGEGSGGGRKLGMGAKEGIGI